MYYYFKKTLFLFFLPAFLGLAGCGNDDLLSLEGMTVQEIQGLFVGEWKETERGNDNDPERSFPPQDYTFEFLANGSVSYDYEGSFPLPDLGEHTYRVDREFLYFYYEAGNHSIVFRYIFYTRDKFRMDFESGFQAMIPGAKFFVYERIK
jgi:hypothetical protein